MIAISHVTRSSTAFGAFAAFVTIEIRRALRNRRYVMFSVAFPTAFYLLYTGVLSAGSPADSTDRGTTWGAYFMVSMATYAAMIAALGGAIVIARERSSGWTRQLRVTPLPAAGYVAGKLLVAYVVTLPAIAAVVAAGIAVNHVSLPTARWSRCSCRSPSGSCRSRRSACSSATCSMPTARRAR